MAASSAGPFTQAGGPVYFASLLLGRHGVEMAVLPPFMPGPWAVDLSGRSKQSRSPITPTRTTIAEVFSLSRIFECAIGSGITQPRSRFIQTRYHRLQPRS